MMTIAFVDVHYGDDGARAACVVAPSWDALHPSATYAQQIDEVQPYEPGAFYRRELPCLLSVLRLLPALPDIIVVDGYVWLASSDRAGLGAHLYEALGRHIPVVGIAKTLFAGADACPTVVPVERGESKNPLFVTAVGIDVATVAECVRRMSGEHRIPDLLRITDQISRGHVAADVAGEIKTDAPIGP